MSTEVLEKLGVLAQHERFDDFWELLHHEGVSPTPKYGYSGYVVAVAVAYLAEHDVTLPVDETHDSASKLRTSTLSPLVLADLESSHAAARQLAALRATDVELGAYFEEFVGETWAEAGGAMREAVAYITNALTRTDAARPWCLVFVG